MKKYIIAVVVGINIGCISSLLYTQHYLFFLMFMTLVWLTGIVAIAFAHVLYKLLKE